jgi:hypothetical protein
MLAAGYVELAAGYVERMQALRWTAHLTMEFDCLDENALHN